MKIFIFFTLFVTISAAPVADGPSQISGNNVGDLINGDIDGNLKLNNQVNAFLLNFLFGAINQQQLAVVAPAGPEPVKTYKTDERIIHKEVPKIDPKTIEKLREALSQKHF